MEIPFFKHKNYLIIVIINLTSTSQIILTNPYVHYDYSNFKNRTIVRKTVPYGTIFRRKISMKLQDKHREFAIKCYAKFMNTNATIVFQSINYSGGTETRHYNESKSSLCQKLYTPECYNIIAFIQNAATIHLPQ